MRKQQRLSQRRLAEVAGAGLTQEILSRIERGHRAPSLEQALALSRVLGVPAEVLFAFPEINERAAA